MKLEIVDFREKRFCEIPKQDNPAFENKECIMIFKAEETQTGCFVVVKINEDEKEVDGIAQLGLFWDYKMALLFAENIESTATKKPIEERKCWTTLLNHEYPLWGR